MIEQTHILLALEVAMRALIALALLAALASPVAAGPHPWPPEPNDPPAGATAPPFAPRLQAGAVVWHDESDAEGLMLLHRGAFAAYAPRPADGAVALPLPDGWEAGPVYALRGHGLLLAGWDAAPVRLYTAYLPTLEAP